ncbi:AIPR protein [Pirellula sp. SH-Sr6A]|uniref:AIPR family protein n=1 Tax=Pirellula sp. SH-Sr6A TaxID=1632865 RepID=UPI00078BC54C|nr:AIPR family protein [Pirellula sp. SH-Sr6A]AMV35270.1 AIPR protein [Pirellula sp. SH-Sr6A]
MNKQADLTFKDLQSEIKELSSRFNRFKDDDLFVLWFLRAYITETEEAAADAITGGSNDKGVDALLVDHAAQCVFVVQGKYRQALGSKSEPRSEVMAFLDLAAFLNSWPDNDCMAYLKTADEAVAERLREARNAVQKHGYDTRLFFVTTGKVSPTVRDDAMTQVRQVSKKARIEIIDSHRAMLLFRDYLDGVAPPIPSADLEMEAGAGIQVNGISQRFDHNTGVESWVFSMRGAAVAEIFEKSGLRLFARNIRGYMGEKTSVNQGMVATLESEPEKFFFYNNGITIVCDAAERKGAQGRDLLRVDNPQIINGQQTTRTLAAHAKLAEKASVLVKVIVVPRDNNQRDGFDGLISAIVAGTNWQNAIKQSDLMSNDRRQIEIERAFRKVGYMYLRKRQSKGETRRAIGRGQYRVITKEELAQAVAGCELDPTIIRSGREKLFSEQYYNTVFPNSDADFYLPKYWLMREVSWSSKGKPERAYAKWLVLNSLWTRIEPLLRGAHRLRSFRKICESQLRDGVVPLSKVIDLSFIEALRFFRDSRGSGESAIDVSAFFKSRKGLEKEFSKFIKAGPESRRKTFENALVAFKAAVDNFES